MLLEEGEGKQVQGQSRKGTFKLTSHWVSVRACSKSAMLMLNNAIIIHIIWNLR